MEHASGEPLKDRGALAGSAREARKDAETARSDDHAKRVRGWISETETKLRNTEETLAGLRENIQSVESKLKRR